MFRTKSAYTFRWSTGLGANTFDSTAVWKRISVSMFDQRFDGKVERSLMGIVLPGSQKLVALSVTQQENKTLVVSEVSRIPAVCASPIRATRDNTWDLIIAKPDNTLAIVTHGLYELPLDVVDRKDIFADLDVHMDVSVSSMVDKTKVVNLKDAVSNSVTVVYEDGSSSRVTTDLVPTDELTQRALRFISFATPADTFFHFHAKFLELWSDALWSSSPGVEFGCFTRALTALFGVEVGPTAAAPESGPHSAWSRLAMSSSHGQMMDDVALLNLSLPPALPKAARPIPSIPLHPLLAPILTALHGLAEDFRLVLHQQHHLFQLVPVICRIASIIRPEWVDYWKRLCPDAVADIPLYAAGQSSRAAHELSY